MNEKYYLIIGVILMVLWLPYIIINYYLLIYLNISETNILAFLIQVQSVPIIVISVTLLKKYHDFNKKKLDNH